MIFSKKRLVLLDENGQKLSLWVLTCILTSKVEVGLEPVLRLPDSVGPFT